MSAPVDVLAAMDELIREAASLPGYAALPAEFRAAVGEAAHARDAMADLIRAANTAVDGGARAGFYMFELRAAIANAKGRTP